MKRITLTWLALCAALFGAWQLSALDIPHFKLVTPAHAQLTMTGAGAGAPSSGAACSTGGPGDCVSTGWIFWSSAARCFSSSYSGPIADIVDHATGNTTGTRLQCSGGTVSALVSGSACTFVTGNACSTLATTCSVSCNIREYYDQTGGTLCGSAACNFTQTTLANQASYSGSVFGSLGSGLFDFGGSGVSYYTNASCPTLSQPFTIVTMSEPTALGSFQQVVDLNGAQVGFDTGTGTSFAIYAGGEVTGPSASNNSKYAAQYLVDNSGTPAIYVNGSNTAFSASSIGSGACSGTMSIGANSGAGQTYEGYIGEFGLNSAQFNTTGRVANINNNIRTAGGF